MFGYLVRRLLLAIPTLFICSLIVFFVGSLTGRSYFDKKRANPKADRAQIRQEERAEKLHEPLPVQYLLWLSRLCFDLYLGHPEHVVDDLESGSAEQKGISAPGCRISPRNDEAAYGRYSYLVQGRAEETAPAAARAVRIDDFAAFVERGWRAGKGRRHSAWERFARPAGASIALDPDRFRAVRFSLYAAALEMGDEQRHRNIAVEVRAGARATFRANCSLVCGQRWIDVSIPIEAICSGCALNLSADGDFYMDWFRVEERGLRFDWGWPNLGRSAKYDRDVLAVLRPFLVNTLVLGILALLVTWSIAIPLGVYCGVHRGGALDKLFSLAAFLGMSIPNFFLGLVILYVAGCLLNDLGRDLLGFALFPTAGISSGEARSWWGEGLDRLHHLILPVLVISVGTIAGLQRIARGNLIDVLRAHYVRSARAKGLPEHRVIYHHALRNAINPLITIFGYQLSGLLSGAALVEIIFSYPGMGRLIFEAIEDQDRNVVMATVMIAGVLLVLGNLFADILLSLADPRIRLGGERDGV